MPRIEGQVGGEMADVGRLFPGRLSEIGTPAQALTVRAEDSLEFTLAVLDVDGGAKDLSGFDVGIDVLYPTDSAATITLRSAGLAGGADAQIKVAADQVARKGEIDIVVSKTDTHLVTPRDYVWCAVVQKNAERHTVVVARFTVAPALVGALS